MPLIQKVPGVTMASYFPRWPPVKTASGTSGPMALMPCGTRRASHRGRDKFFLLAMAKQPMLTRMRIQAAHADARHNGHSNCFMVCALSIR